MLCSARRLTSIVLSTVIAVSVLTLLVAHVVAQVEEGRPLRQEGWADPLPPRNGDATDENEVRTLDFNDAIQAHARDRELPVEQIRDEALRYLLPARQAGERSRVTTEEVRPGVFRIQAPKSYHDAVAAQIAWLLHGKKQIVIESKIIQISSAQREQLHADFADAWVTSVNGQLPPVDRSPAPATPSMAVSRRLETTPGPLAAANRRLDESTDVVFATTQTVCATPCRIARLTAAQVDKFIQEQRGDNSSNVMAAPKITVFPEQDVVIEATSQRPFVVSVKPTTENGKTTVEPVIQVLEEGFALHVRATPADGRIELASRITFSEIDDVADFTFKLSGVAEPATIQIPHQQIRQIDLAQQIEDGASLLVDPYFFQETTLKKRFRADVTDRRYTLVLISACVIDEE